MPPNLKNFLTISLTIVNVCCHQTTGLQKPTSRKEATNGTDTKLYKTILLAAVLVLVSSEAMAQVRCGDRDNIIEWLAAKYKETPVATGVTTTGGLIEVLSTGEGNTWTIIVTTPQGKSCVVAAGEGWRIRQREADDAEPQA